MTTEKGRFIVLEGIEGCGKDTQLGLLKTAFDQCGIAYVPTLEPGGTPLGSKLRFELKHGNLDICSRAELLLFEAGRAQLCHEVIIPALEAGQHVLCNRFYPSTVAYQGYGRGLDIAEIDRLNASATEGVSIDRIFLFDLPVEQGLVRGRRASAKEGVTHDRFESEELEFHERVRRGYLEQAKDQMYRIIDTSQSNDVQQSIADAHHRIIEDIATLVPPGQAAALRNYLK